MVIGGRYCLERRRRGRRRLVKHEMIGDKEGDQATRTMVRVGEGMGKRGRWWGREGTMKKEVQNWERNKVWKGM